MMALAFPNESLSGLRHTIHTHMKILISKFSIYIILYICIYSCVYIYISSNFSDSIFCETYSNFNFAKLWRFHSYLLRDPCWMHDIKPSQNFPTTNFPFGFRKITRSQKSILRIVTRTLRLYIYYLFIYSYVYPQTPASTTIHTCITLHGMTLHYIA